MVGLLEPSAAEASLHTTRSDSFPLHDEPTLTSRRSSLQASQEMPVSIEHGQGDGLPEMEQAAAEDSQENRSEHANADADADDARRGGLEGANLQRQAMTDGEDGADEGAVEIASWERDEANSGQLIATRNDEEQDRSINNEVNPPTECIHSTVLMERSAPDGSDDEEIWDCWVEISTSEGSNVTAICESDLMRPSPQKDSKPTVRTPRTGVARRAVKANKRGAVALTQSKKAKHKEALKQKRERTNRSTRRSASTSKASHIAGETCRPGACESRAVGGRLLRAIPKTPKTLGGRNNEVKRKRSAGEASEDKRKIQKKESKTRSGGEGREKKRSTMRETDSAGKHLRKGSKVQTQTLYSFPSGFDKTSTRILLSSLAPNSDAQRGNDVSLMLDLFKHYDDVGFMNMAKGERLTRLSRQLKFRVDMVDGMRGPLAALETRAAIWCAGKEPPGRKSGLNIDQASKTLSIMIDEVAEHGPADRWHSLLAARDFKVDTVNELQQMFRKLTDGVVRAWRDGHLQP